MQVGLELEILLSQLPKWLGSQVWIPIPGFSRIQGDSLMGLIDSNVDKQAVST